MKKLNQQGQTLIEAIVAVGIMILGIMAILSLALMSLTVAGISKERIVALNLAREGIEIVRAVRDTNWLKNDKCWEVDNCGLENNNWLVDYQTINLETIVDSSDINNCLNCQLKINENGLYNFIEGSPTNYKRVVFISSGDNPEEKKIISQVQWQDHSRKHLVELEARLSNWR